MIKLLKKKKDTESSRPLNNLASRTSARTHNSPRQNTRIHKEHVKSNQMEKEAQFERETLKNENRLLFKKTLIWAGGIIGGIALILLISFGFLQITHIILNHSYFTIQTIEITGSPQFSNEEIIQLSGLEEESNYFAIDENAIEARMLQNTWIENVDIIKEFPNTLHLQVSERVPYFWILHEEKLFYIDAFGQIIAPVKSENFVSLPILELGQSPDEALLLLPEFIASFDARVDMLPFSFNDIVWIRLSASKGIEMYWEDEKILLSFALENLKENIEKMIFALQDLERRNEIDEIAEIHAGYGQVWFVFD